MEELLVAPTDSTVLYVSRRSQLRLTMRPRYPQRDPSSGQLTGTTKGAFIGFRDGQVRIPKEGEYVAVDTLDGGESAPMPAEDIHDWLMRHRLYGNREEGFWRVDPTAPPVSQDEMRALMHAALTLDADMLNEIMRQEREGWGRSQILEEAQEALDKIQMIAEQQQEEPAKAKPGPKPKAAPES
jgi:hypothetical protein